jgi:hypothetical protein
MTTSLATTSAADLHQERIKLFRFTFHSRKRIEVALD